MPREVFLHEQHRLDRCPAAALEKMSQPLPCKFLGQNAWREGHPPFGRLVALVQANAPEVALILENQRAIGVLEDEMIVFARREIRVFLAAQLAAHSQVNAHPEAA